MQLSAITTALGRFLAELQRRKVLRIAAGYVVGAWIVLQVAVALQTAMSLSASFSAAILALLVIGFFVVAVLAWFYEITPEGVKRTAPATGDAPFVKPQTTDLILAGALALVVVVALVQLLTPSPTAPPATAPATTAEATPAKPEPPALGDKSIAVLPFANLSPDKENEYFADGLTEELLNLLAKIGDLKVISRTSSFAFKGKNTPLPEIAKTLGVRHILEGSVRVEGEDLRVTAQLIDVTTDTHLWSETYERRIENVLALQDELSRDIVGALKIEVTLKREDPPTLDIGAYRSYLEGLERRARGALSSPEITELFKRATELDPRFAEAHAGLAASYSTRIGVAPTSQYSELAALARKSAEDAIALKPTLGLAHGVLGVLDRIERKWESALAKGEKAVALDPTDSNARLWLAGTQLALGYFNQSAETLAELRRRDPLFDYAASMEMTVEVARGNIAAAEAIANSAIGRGVILPLGQYVLAGIAYDRGDAAAAGRHYRLYLPPFQQERPFVAAVIKAFHGAAARDAAVKALLDEASSDQSFDAMPSLVLLRAYEAAFPQDTLMFRRPTGFSASGFALIWDPRHTLIRRDPRFKVILRTLGFVDYWKKHGWPDRCRPKGEDDFECS